MATIRKRQFINSHLYEVQVRRRGIPSLTVSFGTLEEAKDWVTKNEFEYLKNPEKYRNKIATMRLKMKWLREENRR